MSLNLDESLLRELKLEARRQGYVVFTASREELLLWSLFLLGVLYGLAVGRG